MHTITPIASLTASEIRYLAHAAADRNAPVHEACPFEPHSEQYHRFQNAYVERRHELLSACA